MEREFIDSDVLNVRDWFSDPETEKALMKITHVVLEKHRLGHYQSVDAAAHDLLHKMYRLIMRDLSDC